MDVEARRKYCGLLMFDVPNVASKSPNSRNDIIINNMSMDSSSLNNFPYDSRNMNSLDHQFVMQDGFSEFSSSTRALAAGAAAGGNQEDFDSSNGVDGDVNSNSKGQAPKRTPRPPNAFILYRRAKQPGIIASQRNLTNAQVSRTISDMWRKEPEEIRLEWERYADRKKLEHMQTYPNYVYRPNKNKSKVDKRRQSRRQNSTKDSANSSNNNNLDDNKSSSNPGPVRRKSTKGANSKPPTKLDLPLNDGISGFVPSSTNSRINSTSYATILPSPEIPMLATTQFTDQPSEFVSQSQLTPVTPLTPHTPLTPISTPEQMQMRENDFKIRNNLLQLVPDLSYQQQHHQQHQQQQQGAPQFPFQPIQTTVDPLEYCLPDVVQAQQQYHDEYMLHHEHHRITPATVPSSSSVPTSTVQYFPNGTNVAALGNHTFTDMLGLDFNNFFGSVNHDNSYGLGISDQYLQ